MPSYSYVITDPAGNQQKGTLTSDNRAEAVSQLRANGSQVISIEEAILGGVGGKNEAGGGGPKPKVKELAVFCRQFVSIVEAGVPVVNCLDMLGEQTQNEKLRYGILDCKAQIQGGETLSSAMAMHPKVFPPLMITLTAAGEASGSLEVSMTRMATQLEKEAHLQSTIKKATVYPTVVMVVAMCVVVVMLVFVVPQFEMMFADMGTTLPAITIWVLGMSAYLQERWYIVLACMIGGFLGIIKFFKSPLGQSFSSVVTLKMPVVRDLVNKSACARMARTLSTLLGSGMNIMESIEITSETMTNLLYKAAVANVAAEVGVGQPMNVALKEANLFPPLVYHMVSIGEETGNTEKMLDTLAGYYEEEVEAATESLMALLEPATIILLAVVVGGIIGAVMAPMAKMYEELGNL